MISVRESLGVVRQAVSIRQLARQRNKSFPLSLRQFIGAPPANTFPENEVEVSREYVPTEVGKTPSQVIEEKVRARLLTYEPIQERSPINGRPISANAAALARKRARLWVRDHSFLGTFAIVLDKLHAVYGHLRKHEFDQAETALGEVPPPTPLPDITLLLSNIEEAFASDDLPYVIMNRIDLAGGAYDVEIIEATCSGYWGLVLDVPTALELVMRGPERDFRLRLLKAEITFGKRNFDEAIRLYDALLTATPSGSPRHKFVALRAAFARLALADQRFRRQRTLSDQERQDIAAAYEAAVRLLQERGVSPANPLRRQVELYAGRQKAKLQSGLNYLGLWDAFVPVQRYSKLEELAEKLIGAASDSVGDFQKLLQQAEQETERQMDVRFQQDQEESSRVALDLRRANATLSVDKITEQIRAIEDQQDFLIPGAVLGGFRALVAEYDYRVLQPRLVADANGNRRAVSFSPLGLVTATAVMGKEGEPVGDTRETPGSRLAYDFFAFVSRRQPVFVRSIAREHHVNDIDVPLPARDATIETVEYSDGFGQLLQTRTQAEDVLFGDRPSADQSGATADAVGRRRAAGDPPNVIVSGWQSYNNKGQVVEKFEPFFSKGFAYLSPEKERAQYERDVLGQKATMFYDPRGQVIRTVNPDGSEQRVIYGGPGRSHQTRPVRPHAMGGLHLRRERPGAAEFPSDR